MTDPGWGNGSPGAMPLMAVVRKARDSFRCLSALWLSRPRWCAHCASNVGAAVESACCLRDIAVADSVLHVRYGMVLTKLTLGLEACVCCICRLWRSFPDLQLWFLRIISATSQEIEEGIGPRNPASFPSFSLSSQPSSYLSRSRGVCSVVW
jgi:hypothetical protein